MALFDITIAGELNLDLILYGLPASLPVERELLATDFRIVLGSSSAILAHNISTLGIRTGFITRVGSDDFGRVALERLAESGVDLSRVVCGLGDTPTGVTVLLDHSGTRHILTYPGVMAEMTADDLDVSYLASSRHFHLSSLFLQKGLHAGLPDLFKHLHERQVTISLDTNDDPSDQWGGIIDDLLPYVDVLLPNHDEVCRIAGRDTVEEALDLLSQTVPLIAVKCGRRGAMVQSGTLRSTVPGIDVVSTDTIGAGDSFNAGFLAAYLRGANPIECAQAGNTAGALSTLRPGGTDAFRDNELRGHFFREQGLTWP